MIGHDSYEIDILVQGYPGKAVCHGGLGWSTIALLRGQDRCVLIDVGAFGTRKIMLDQLAERGLAPEDVTDVILSHSHYDHSINWVAFDNAMIHIGGDELAWALKQPSGRTLVPELYVSELVRCDRLRKIHAGDEVVPGIVAHDAPGHTPGHLVFVLTGGRHDVVFTGDAAKNRAELVGMDVDMTLDADASRRTLELIWSLWRKRPGSLLVPGHDLPMSLDDDGGPAYIGERHAAIRSWFADSIETCTVFDLSHV